MRSLFRNVSFIEVLNRRLVRSELLHFSLVHHVLHIRRSQIPIRLPVQLMLMLNCPLFLPTTRCLLLDQRGTLIRRCLNLLRRLFVIDYLAQLSHNIRAALLTGLRPLLACLLLLLLL